MKVYRVIWLFHTQKKKKTFLTNRKTLFSFLSVSSSSWQLFFFLSCFYQYMRLRFRDLDHHPTWAKAVQTALLAIERRFLSIHSSPARTHPLSLITLATSKFWKKIWIDTFLYRGQSSREKFHHFLLRGISISLYIYV